MIDPRWRKVLRDVWLHKSRTILVVLAISVGIIGAGSVLNTWSLLRKVTREEFSASNPASATLRTDSIDAALLDRVRAMPAVQSAQARRTVTGSVLTGSGWKTAVLMSSPDFAGSRIGLIKREGGEWPPSDNSLVVESSSMEFSGAEVGGRFTVQVGDSAPRDLAILGEARDVGLPPGWMEHVVYLFVTPATLASLGAPSSFDRLQILVNDRALTREGVRAVAAEVKGVVEGTGRSVREVDVPVPGRHEHAGQIDSLLYTQGAFGLLALLLSGFLVVNLVSAMLSGQVREIGVMKALGARTGQIAAMYLVLAFVLGLIACIVAIPAAAIIGRLYAEFTADLLNFDISGSTIPGWVTAMQVSVGILLPVIAASVPVRRGCSITVSEALRDYGIGGQGDADGGVLIRRVSGVTRPLLLSLRNAFRRKQRMVLTLVTLSLGGAVYLGATNLERAIVASVDTMFGTQRFDMVLRFTRPHAIDSVEAIAAGISGVEGVEAWAGTRASVARTDGMVSGSFPVTALPADSRMLEMPVMRGRWLRSGDGNALVVNRRLSEDDQGMDVGKTVELTVAGKPSRWEIVGVVDAGPSPTAYATRETISAMATNGGSATIVVATGFDGPASQLDLIQRLRGAFADAGIQVQSSQLMVEQRRVVEDHLLMVAGFLGIMAQLIIVVGGLGLASTMSLSVLERTREIGVLRAIGARHRSILMMVQTEGLVIATLSWLVAIPLSVPMSVVLGRAFGRIMLRVPITLFPGGAAILGWLGVVVIVAIVACAWPAFRAMRVPVAAALAYE